jgi:hypothetical protein
LSGQALYVYGLLAERDLPAEPSGEGIDGAPLLFLRAEECGLAALVHEAAPEPYQGPDDDVRRWIRAHDEAVEQARRAAGAVLPMTFNVLVSPGEDGDAVTRLRGWLAEHRRELHERLDRVRGRAEYRVEITLDTASVETGPEAAEIEERMRRSSPGLQRLLNKQLDSRRRAAADAVADRLHAEARRRLGAIADDIADRRVAVRVPGHLEVLSIALLVRESDEGELGLILAELQESHPAARVRFLGPWPPYSFTGDQPTAPGTVHGLDADHAARKR